MSFLSLCSHPDTPNSSVKKLSCSVIALDNGDLHLSYHLKGDLQRMLIAELAPSEPKDNLWEHSCFEAFISVDREKAYREYNFSPSSQWAIYAFSDYRVKLNGEASESPSIKRKQRDGELIISVVLPSSCLPDNPQKKPLLIGLSAVIETRDNTISYWALKHPMNTPDFHHRESFNLRINPFN